MLGKTIEAILKSWACYVKTEYTLALHQKINVKRKD